MGTKIVKFIVSILICQAVGIIGGLFTSFAIPDWYATLAKPAFSPPNWVFAPVWTVLYLLMGVALFLVWKGELERREVKIALGAFSIQLFLNAIWSVIFFGLRNPGWAFIDIILLWFAIIWTIVVFAKVSRLAAFLFIPYLLWVSFAAYLNYSIWTLNQEGPVACTADARLCPDGSYVSRTPPDCDFAPCPQTRTIKLYYYDQELDKDESGNIACSRDGLVPVERVIPVSQTPIQDTIRLLISGDLGSEEQFQGISTEYPLEGFSLESASLKDGVLTLEFSDPNNETIGGSCRVGILWFQIEATAKQFSGVEEVRFLPDEIFQP